MLRHLSLWGLLLLSFNACQQPEKGKVLADKYCSGCHLPVTPDMLDKKTWTDNVLPAMALRLGIKVWSGTKYYPPMKGDGASSISIEDWNTIVDYFKTNAPDKLPVAKHPVAWQHDWANFELKTPHFTDTTFKAATTLVSFYPSNGAILTSDGLNTLTKWDKQLNPIHTWQLPSPAVSAKYQIDTSDNSIHTILTEIGNLRALDAPAGIITSLNTDDTSSKQKDIMAFLKRPVATLTADFNKDGLNDLLVCAFGHNQGGLYQLQQQPDHSWKQLPIWEVPGAIHAEVGDFNNDGYPDIIALFAAGDEGIWLFENDKKNGFISKNLLRFPPLYGSTSFQLIDFNNDGKLDILYTAGDNADYSMVLKPYHGIYVYINQGNWKFEQAWHYPINGCTKAIAADFNGDGKIDIASIAFFADFKNLPSEKFLYFEGGKKSLDFTVHAIPIEKEGRWISMDVNDYDQDGDLDIVLGNYAAGFLILDQYKPDWKEYQPFIILENKSKK
ncbi:VCBS repeat-containing protein [Chitinophaga silvatica]|uniref:VCBS repeat-containing protein n=1 Tax=Chitinophaga silvatica TaxID=2282649 RepID=A0A3E1YAN5_9BACT|nr:VCBS repeat-containing protein [Chitinophaga silvatica]RFS22742.1 VCBS repeat-containing protein [Chitinophaga silvatica]